MRAADPSQTLCTSPAYMQFLRSFLRKDDARSVPDSVSPGGACGSNALDCVFIGMIGGAFSRVIGQQKIENGSTQNQNGSNKNIKMDQKNGMCCLLPAAQGPGLQAKFKV